MQRCTIYILCVSVLSLAATASGQKPELYFQTGHTASISAAVFSPNGKLVATGGGADSTVKIWDVATGLEIRTFKGSRAFISSVAFSNDGKLLAGGSSDTVKLWNVQSGEELHTFFPDQGSVHALQFSLDGSMLACGSDKDITIWDPVSGKLLRTLIGHTNRITSLALSRDGQTLLSGSWDDTIIKWNPNTGELIKRFARSDRVLALAFANDERTLAVGEENSLALLNLASESEQKIVTKQKPNGLRSLQFSSDGKLLRAIEAFYVREFDAEAAQEIEVTSVNPEVSVLNWTPPTNHILALSPDSNTLAISSKASDGYNFLKLQNTLTQKGTDAVLRTSEVSLAVFSPDGSKIASSGWDKTIKIWNMSDHRELKTIGGLKTNVVALAFALDGSVLAGADGVTLKVWDAETGREKAVLEGHSKGVTHIAFSQDGNLLASGGYDGTAKVWNLRTSKVISTVKAGESPVVALSADGEILATGQSEKIELWHTTSGKLYKSFTTRNFSEQLTAQRFIKPLVPDIYDISKRKRRYKKFEIDKAANGQLILSDTGAKNILATLSTVGNSDWLVIAPDGYFDGTPATWKQLIWRFDNSTFNYAPVEAFFKEFYRPGLLQEIMSGKTPEAPKTDLASIDIRQPEIKIVAVDDQNVDAVSLGQSARVAATLAKREVEVTIDVVDNTKPGRRPDHKPSSGAQDLRLFRGGSLVRHWKGDVFDKDSGCPVFAATATDPRRATCKTTVAITAGNNEFSAYAFNSQNVKSTDATAVVRGADSLKRDGTFYVLAVGVDKYANSDNNLKYAVADVDKIGTELAAQQVNLKKYARTEVIKLTNENATRANILLALKRFSSGGDASDVPENVRAELSKINRSQPEDAILFHFSGHGTARCNIDAKSNKKNCDRFYLLPHDGFENNYQNAISDKDLETHFEPIDAGKLLMVIDACNSGQALEAEEKRRGPMNSRGLAQLAYEKGIFILTASQSHQAALETNRLGHGLLTYSLLQGLQKADKSAAGEVIDRNWFNYASAEVPRLQLEEMQKRDADNAKPAGTKGPKIFVVNGEDPNLPPEKRGLQSPRSFYRREAEADPFVVARP